MALASRFFTTAETNALRMLPATEQRSAFFRCWTRKEALVKAQGDGLATSLSSFEVGITADDMYPILFPCDRTAARWRVMSIPVMNRYAAAVAAEGEDWTLIQCGSMTVSAIARIIEGHRPTCAP